MDIDFFNFVTKLDNKVWCDQCRNLRLATHHRGSRSGEAAQCGLQSKYAVIRTGHLKRCLALIDQQSSVKMCFFAFIFHHTL